MEFQFHFTKSFRSPILFFNIILYGLTVHQSAATVTVIRAACTAGQSWTPAFATLQNWCLTCVCLLGSTSVCKANVGILPTAGQCGIVVPLVTIPPVIATTTAAATTARPVTTTPGQVVVPPVTAPPAVTTTTAGGGAVVVPPVTPPVVATTTAGGGQVIVAPPGGKK